MRKLGRRFETVPLVEVLKKAVEVGGPQWVEKTTSKDEPYSVGKVVRIDKRTTPIVENTVQRTSPLNPSPELL